MTKWLKLITASQLSPNRCWQINTTCLQWKFKLGPHCASLITVRSSSLETIKIIKNPILSLLGELRPTVPSFLPTVNVGALCIWSNHFWTVRGELLGARPVQRSPLSYFICLRAFLCSFFFTCCCLFKSYMFYFSRKCSLNIIGSLEMISWMVWATAVSGALLSTTVATFTLSALLLGTVWSNYGWSAICAGFGNTAATEIVLWNECFPSFPDLRENRTFESGRNKSTFSRRESHSQMPNHCSRLFLDHLITHIPDCHCDVSSVAKLKPKFPLRFVWGNHFLDHFHFQNHYLYSTNYLLFI